MPLKTPRLSRCRVSLAKKPSTTLSQDAEVGVKWKWNRTVLGQPRQAIRFRVGQGMHATAQASATASLAPGRLKSHSESANPVSGNSKISTSRSSFARCQIRHNRATGWRE